MTTDSLPPSDPPDDEREDTGVIAMRSPGTWSPTERIRIDVHDLKRDMATLRKLGWIVMGAIVAGAAGTLVTFATLVYWVGARSERQDADHALVERLDRRVERCCVARERTAQR